MTSTIKNLAVSLLLVLALLIAAVAAPSFDQQQIYLQQRLDLQQQQLQLQQLDHQQPPLQLGADLLREAASAAAA